MGPPAKATRSYRLTDLSRRLQRIARWVWDQHQVACRLWSFPSLLLSKLVWANRTLRDSRNRLFSFIIAIGSGSNCRAITFRQRSAKPCLWAVLVLTLGFYCGKLDGSTV